MKLWKIALICIGLTFFILGIFLIVPVIILNKSWKWFFYPLLGMMFAWFSFGLIILALKLWFRPKPLKEKIDLRDAKIKAVYDMKYDEDNPDNFYIVNHQTLKIGRQGAEVTPIAFFSGKGMELNQIRVHLINLSNPKETSSLVDPSDDEISYAISKLADYPPEEIKEEITTRRDQFGFPEIVRKTSRPSVEEKEKEEAEKKNAM